MSEKTIALSGAEVKVTFSGGNAWIRNDGASTVYAAKTAGITAGADGVVSIPAGGSAPVYGANGTVFLLGSGSVQLIGSDYATNPFKASAQAGGSGADDVARAAINAHAENTGIHVTVDEKAAWSGKADKSGVLNYLGVVPDLFAVNKTCVCTYDFDTLNTPLKAGVTSSGGGLCFIDCENGAEYVSYLVMPSGDPNFYSTNSMNGALNGEWKKLNDGGNADTLDGLHVSDIQIDIVADAAGIVTLDGLQGGVPFSDITLSGDDIVEQEITLTVNDTEYSVTPDSNPYIIPNEIRQQEGINSVSVSAGEVSVTGVKRNATIKKIWDKLDELTAAIIVSNGETTE